MHWDQMSATPDDLRKRATRLRRGVGQLGVLESIIEVADGPWLGAMDADGRGTAELRMHLAGRYRLMAVVTSAGKLSLIQLHTPTTGERVLSTKPAQRQGWTDTDTMPKQPAWLDYVIDWVSAASAQVGRRAVIEWQLDGADRRLAAMNDTIDGMRASLLEREELRDTLAAEIGALRTELDTLPTPPPPAPAARDSTQPAPPPHADASTRNAVPTDHADPTEPDISAPPTQAQPLTAPPPLTSADRPDLTQGTTSTPVDSLAHSDVPVRDTVPADPGRFTEPTASAAPSFAQPLTSAQSLTSAGQPDLPQRATSTQLGTPAHSASSACDAVPAGSDGSTEPGVSGTPTFAQPLASVERPDLAQGAASIRLGTSVHLDASVRDAIPENPGYRPGEPSALARPAVEPATLAQPSASDRLLSPPQPVVSKESSVSAHPIAPVRLGVPLASAQASAPEQRLSAGQFFAGVQSSAPRGPVTSEGASAFEPSLATGQALADELPSAPGDLATSEGSFTSARPIDFVRPGIPLASARTSAPGQPVSSERPVSAVQPSAQPVASAQPVGVAQVSDGVRLREAGDPGESVQRDILGRVIVPASVSAPESAATPGSTAPDGSGAVCP